MFDFSRIIEVKTNSKYYKNGDDWHNISQNTKNDIIDELSEIRKNSNTFYQAINNSYSDKGIVLNNNYEILKLDQLINEINNQSIASQWKKNKENKIVLINKGIYHLLTNNTINTELKSWRYYKDIMIEINKINFNINKYLSIINNEQSLEKQLFVICLYANNPNINDDIIVNNNVIDKYNFINITVNSFFLNIIQNNLTQLNNSKKLLKQFDIFKSNCSYNCVRFIKTIEYILPCTISKLLIYKKKGTDPLILFITEFERYSTFILLFVYRISEEDYIKFHKLYNSKHKENELLYSFNKDYDFNKNLDNDNIKDISNDDCMIHIMRHELNNIDNNKFTDYSITNSEEWDSLILKINIYYMNYVFIRS
jgi:hypothetical protein